MRCGCGPGGAAESATQRQAGDLGLKRRQQAGGKIFQVDGRKAFGGNVIQLDFVTGRKAEQSDLAGSVFNAQQAQGLLKGKRSGGELGMH